MSAFTRCDDSTPASNLLTIDQARERESCEADDVGDVAGTMAAMTLVRHRRRHTFFSLCDVVDRGGLFLGMSFEYLCGNGADAMRAVVHNCADSPALLGDFFDVFGPDSVWCFFYRWPTGKGYAYRAVSAFRKMGRQDLAEYLRGIRDVVLERGRPNVILRPTPLHRFIPAVADREQCL